MFTALVATVLLSASPIRDYETAIKESEASGKPLVAFVSATWCRYCPERRAKMERLRAAGRLDDVNYTVIDYDRQAAARNRLMPNRSDQMIPRVIVLRKVKDGWAREEVAGVGDSQDVRVEDMLDKAIAAAKDRQSQSVAP